MSEAELFQTWIDAIRMLWNPLLEILDAVFKSLAIVGFALWSLASICAIVLMAYEAWRERNRYRHCDE